jgi:hypothetical protein
VKDVKVAIDGWLHRKSGLGVLMRKPPMLDSEQRAPRTGTSSIQEQIKLLHPSFPSEKKSARASEGVSRVETLVGCFCKVCCLLRL